MYCQDLLDPLGRTQSCNSVGMLASAEHQQHMQNPVYMALCLQTLATCALNVIPCCRHHVYVELASHAISR